MFLEPSIRPGAKESHLLLSKQPEVWKLSCEQLLQLRAKNRKQIILYTVHTYILSTREAKAERWVLG